MTDRDPKTWLDAVFIKAQAANWCVRPYCTTCGCLEFRRAYWSAAARQAGIQLGSEPHPREILSGLSSSEHTLIVKALVDGLRELPSVWSGSEALRTVILDLDPPFLRHGVPMVLDDELSGTPAGETLASMQAHDEEVWRRRERRQAYESPEAVQERRRAKKEEKAIEHARRQFESHQRNAKRIKLLNTLASLSPAERLRRFATDSSIMLGLISFELIPAQKDDLIGLDSATASTLIARIDRRRGAWGRLRSMLEHFIEDKSRHTDKE